MPIHLDNGDNPMFAYYNNTPLNTINFNNVRVWGENPEDPTDVDRPWPGDPEAGSDYPLSSVITITSGNCKAWVRNPQKRMNYLMHYAGEEQMYYAYEYSCDCTYEIPLHKGALIGITNQSTPGALANDTGQATVSGIPSSGIVSLDLPGTITIGLGCYKHSGSAIGAKDHNGVFSITTTHVIASSYFYPLFVSLAHSGDFIVINDLISKWTYQGTATFTLYLPA